MASNAQQSPQGKTFLRSETLAHLITSPNPVPRKLQKKDRSKSDNPQANRPSTSPSATPSSPTAGWKPKRTKLGRFIRPGPKRSDSHRPMTPRTHIQEVNDFLNCPQAPERGIIRPQDRAAREVHNHHAAQAAYNPPPQQVAPAYAQQPREGERVVRVSSRGVRYYLREGRRIAVRGGHDLDYEREVEEEDGYWDGAFRRLQERYTDFMELPDGHQFLIMREME